MTTEAIIEKVQGYVFLFRCTGGYKIRRQCKLSDPKLQAAAHGAMQEIGQLIAQFDLALKVMEQGGILEEFERQRAGLSKASKKRGGALAALEASMAGPSGDVV